VKVQTKGDLEDGNE